MGIYTKVIEFLLPLYDFFRLKMVKPFTQTELDGMKPIEEKAMIESKKKIAVGIANAEDIIELTIQRKSVELTRSTNNPIWKNSEKYVLRFIREVVAKYPKEIRITINIGLHDTYFADYGFFSFSNNNKSNLNILMPDMYAMKDYNKRLGQFDDIEFHHKKHQAIFIGSTTGNIYPLKNDRLQICNHFLKNDRVKCYINNICQMSEDDIAAVFPAYKNFMHPTIHSAIQLENKFIITIDGNTAAWDRLMWILNSNSVCLKKKSDHHCWYYDFLENEKHYIEFEEFDQIEKIMDTITTEQCLEIIKNANAFVNEFLTHDKQLAYMGHLLYYCSVGKTSDIRRQTS